MQAPQVHIDTLMQIWAAMHKQLLYKDTKNLNTTINTSSLSEVP